MIQRQASCLSLTVHDHCTCGLFDLKPYLAAYEILSLSGLLALSRRRGECCSGTRNVRPARLSSHRSMQAICIDRSCRFPDTFLVRR